MATLLCRVLRRQVARNKNENRIDSTASFGDHELDNDHKPVYDAPILGKSRC